MKRRYSARRPQEISNVFSSRGFSAKLKGLVPMYRISRAWAQIAGPEIAQRTQPLRIEKNRLVVRVESPSWKMQLEFMKLELLERIAQETSMVFEDLQFIPGAVRVVEFSQNPIRLQPEPERKSRLEGGSDASESLVQIMDRVRGKMNALSQKSRS
mgnify:CR=1 FL=1